jgi:hypothetical protein
MSEPTRDRIQRMVELPVGADRVWDVIGDFADMGWHPLVAQVEPVTIEGAPYRHVTLTDGSVFLERLVEQAPHHLTYESVEGPLPMTDHRATLSVAPEDFGCRVFWSGLFEPQDGADEWCDRIVAGFYEEGLGALRERFADG